MFWLVSRMVCSSLYFPTSPSAIAWRPNLNAPLRRQRIIHRLTHVAPSSTGQTPAEMNPYPDLKSQKAFEKGLLEKTAKQTGDIILYDNRVV